jgi:hypothetical protein
LVPASASETEGGVRILDEFNDIGALNTVSRHQKARNMLVE